MSSPYPYMCSEYAEPGVPHCRRRLKGLNAEANVGVDHRSRSRARPCVGGGGDSPTCLAGTRQSPELNLQMHYAEIIPVEYEPEHKKWVVEPYSRDSHVMAKGQRFNLIQFHLHSPSEHQFDGKVYPAELHFVHQNPVTSQLLVFGLLFGHDGNNSAVFLDELASPTSIAKGELDLALGSLPEVRAIQNWIYYHYMGSLTADSCAEDVIWAVSSYIAPSSEMVVCNHVGLSGIFSTAQPFQLLNERVIKHSTWATPKLAQTDLIVVVSGAVGVAMLVALGSVFVMYRHKQADGVVKLADADATSADDAEWHDAQLEFEVMQEDR
ncbi:alpha carbonic anhydrase [Pavlovales sp. CCMP2436]|nr:alpha carbonic anhydrase [Pavlovales sp. CCMP2436]